MRSREAAWRILRARIETGFEPKRTSDKRPNQPRRAAGLPHLHDDTMRKNMRMASVGGYGEHLKIADYHIPIRD